MSVLHLLLRPVVVFSVFFWGGGGVALVLLVSDDRSVANDVWDFSALHFCVITSPHVFPSPVHLCVMSPSFVWPQCRGRCSHPVAWSAGVSLAVQVSSVRCLQYNTVCFVSSTGLQCQVHAV